MSDLLVRGIPTKTRLRIYRLAKNQNLSLNQEILKLLEDALNQAEKQTEIEKRRQAAFKNIRVLREEMARKYGKFDDSTKLIREDRDSR